MYLIIKTGEGGAGSDGVVAELKFLQRLEMAHRGGEANEVIS